MSNDNGKNIVGSIGSTAAIGAAVGSIIVELRVYFLCFGKNSFGQISTGKGYQRKKYGHS